MKKTVLLFFCIWYSTLGLHGQQLDIQAFATGFTNPLNIQNAGDDRLFIVEQGGLIKIIALNGTVSPTPFLDLSKVVSQDGGERGLLGLAFHPDFANTGYFYVDYVDPTGNTQISRFHINDGDPNQADPTSELKMLTIPQPASNHNGGCIAFGPDDYLYIGMGDGGGGGDPDNNGQNTTTLLGALLRIDVNGAEPYANPTDNPFIGNPDGRDEIWAYGLRNPWKFSFDADTGDLWIADVGQGKIEEINRVASAKAGINYGWRCYEGNAVYNDADCPAQSNITFPVATYTHDQGRASITGGYVYRGSDFPDLVGKYIFADFVSSELAYINPDEGINPNITYSSVFEGLGFSSFGLDNAGELYVAGLSSGTIYKVVDADALSLDDVSQDRFGFYPNPATDKLKLVIDPAVNTPHIAIFDLLGKKIIARDINSHTAFIDISSLKKGLYLVQLSSGSATLKTEKLIVN